MNATNVERNLSDRVEKITNGLSSPLQFNLDLKNYKCEVIDEEAKETDEPVKMDMTSNNHSMKVRFMEDEDVVIEPTMNKESILETIKKSQNKTRLILDEFLKPKKFATHSAKISSINLGQRGKTALAESVDKSKVEAPATARSIKMRSSLEVAKKNNSIVTPSKNLELKSSSKMATLPKKAEPLKK